jgi:methylmalonyl-CoA/ethylmalonyl-CoA epimerase
MTQLRRLDHVAILVRDTNEALLYFRDRLGLPVHSTETHDTPPVRLTYLDAGNMFIQLLEPLDADSTLATTLNVEGEGLHHICFGVDDVAEAVVELSDPGAQIVFGSGRGRVSGFINTGDSHGVTIECTEFVNAIESSDDGRPPALAAGGVQKAEPKLARPTRPA